jgi:hypothetical protein
MLQVRCPKCSWSFTLGREAIASIMEEVGETRPTHYTIDCPKCRNGIKIQMRSLRRYYHPPAPEE